jgi:acetyl esterase/lipase
VGVLKYRMPNGTWDAPLEDVHHAFRYARSHADELGIKKVGIMGFSAGGHLAASGVVLYDDPATRPDFGILVYPVISMDAAITHGGTRNALIGSDADWNDRAKYPMDEYLARQAKRDALVEKFSCEKQVTPDTPPVFIALCYDDMVVPPQNSLRFYEACLKNKVIAEMHMYPKGVHGWGFTLKEYGMNDNIDYCRAEFLNSLSRWLGGLEELEAAKRASAQRGMRGGMPGGMPGGAPGGPRPQ